MYNLRSFLRISRRICCSGNHITMVNGLARQV